MDAKRIGDGLNKIILFGLLISGLLFFVSFVVKQGTILHFSIIVGWFFCTVGIAVGFIKICLMLYRYDTDFWESLYPINFSLPIVFVSLLFANKLNDVLSLVIAFFASLIVCYFILHKRNLLNRFLPVCILLISIATIILGLEKWWYSVLFFVGMTFFSLSVGYRFIARNGPGINRVGSKPGRAQ